MNAKTETVTLSEGDIVLDAENCECIMEALLLGLAYLGEFRKAEIAFDSYEQINGEKPKWFDLRGQDNGDGITIFADALRTLRILR